MKLLVDAVRQGYKIVAPSASCSYMLKHDYPDYMPGEESKLIAQNTYDLSEYLVMLNEQGKFNKDFVGTTTNIRYHQHCHLMAQENGMKAKDLMQLLPGTARDVAGRLGVPFIQDKRVLGLAVSTPKRAVALPDVPTTIEAGYPNSEYNFWAGVFLPVKTPAPRRATRNAHHAQARP